MYRYIKGKLVESELGFAVVEAGGIGYKIRTTEDSEQQAHKQKEGAKFYCHLHVREDILDLYGFTSLFELEVFEKLIGVSGVGPKSALAVMNVAGAKELTAAINAGDAEILTKVAGIGKKTAERVVLELKGKIQGEANPEILERMESEQIITETLVSLGYSKGQAKEALEKVAEEITNFEERLKEALKILGKKS